MSDWPSLRPGFNAELTWSSLNPEGAELHRDNVATFYSWAGPQWLAAFRWVEALPELEVSDERWDS